MMTSAFYPGASVDALKRRYVGKRLQDIDGPAAVIDFARAVRNCDAMLVTVERLGVLFRAHIKTHKTTELTRLQVGAEGPVNLLASTVAEIENLVPYLLESKADGRSPNVLYGVPPSPGAIHRLAALARQLSDESSADGIPIAGAAVQRLRSLARHFTGSTNSSSSDEAPIMFLVDHESQIEELRKTDKVWPFEHIYVMIKLDTGAHRSGLGSESPELSQLIRRCHGFIRLRGFYGYSGHSYSSSSEDEAMGYLESDLAGVKRAAAVAKEQGIDEPLILSVGASPSSTSVQNFLNSTASSTSPTAIRVREAIDSLNEEHAVELHAGVYPLLDMQQLATRARPPLPPQDSAVHPESQLAAGLSMDDLALSILVEVSSVYDHRAEPEVLITAGSLALGREPCKSYPGWGVVNTFLSPELVSDAPDGEDRTDTSPAPVIYNETDRTGWIVSKISQEHGILKWEGDVSKKRALRYGEKLLVWPNHACIAGAGFGWYLIVDSSTVEKDIVRDVWVRWRGW